MPIAWLFFMLWVLTAAAAQQVIYPLQSELRCDSVLSNYVAEWQAVRVDISNRSDRTIRFALRAVITKDGRILARTKLPREHMATVAPGETVRLEGAEVFGKLILTGDVHRSDPAWQALADTGIVSLCIAVTDSMGIEHFAEPACRVLRTFSYTVPVPLAPVGDNTVVVSDRKSSVRLAWLPVQPHRRGTCYVVRCFRLPDTLAVAEAIRLQPPLVEQRICDADAFLWHARRLDVGRYVWTVQALDLHSSLPIGSSDGYGPAATFSVTIPAAAHRSQRIGNRRNQRR
jgi:hypothetical protein